MTLFRDQEYLFDQVRPLLPADAAAVIEEQRRRIRAAVANEVEQFGTSLAQYVKAEVDKQIDAQKTALDAARKPLLDALQALEARNAESPSLRELTAKLRGEIDAYETKWRGLGESAANLVKTAVGKATGVQL